MGLFDQVIEFAHSSGRASAAHGELSPGRSEKTHLGKEVLEVCGRRWRRFRAQFLGLQGRWWVRYWWGRWGPWQSPASFAKQRRLRCYGPHSQQQQWCYEFRRPRQPPPPQQQLRTPSNAVIASIAIPDDARDGGIAHLGLHAVPSEPNPRRRFEP